MTFLARLDRWVEGGALAPLDVAFARFLGRLAGGDELELALAAALVSRQVARGHVCLDLRACAGRVVLPGEDDDVGTEPPLTAPSFERWRARLLASAVVGADRPLVLDARGRLYLQRYWRYERSLAAALRARAARPVPVDQERLDADLARLFPAGAGRDAAQRRAVETAVTRALCVVSGGPGTGKTSTVVRIVAALLGQTDDALQFALAAPTGKAATRMHEAMRTAREGLGLDPAVSRRMPDGVQTIHRLLGVRPDGMGFRHDETRPLAADVVIVDEASMVDLALMAHLVAAVRPEARLVLLGDRDQLASVEAGAVLGDICGASGAGGDASPLAACVVLLSESHRFGAASGIGRLAAAVNAGDVVTATGIAEDEGGDDVVRCDGDDTALLRAALDGFEEFVRSVRDGAGAAEAFATLGAFRVLCAHRHGPRGAEAINARLAARLGGDEDWYAGRPVLVTHNDYALRLFNGDVGIALPDPAADGRLRVFFAADEGRMRRLHPLRMPPHETAYAMTVHKSQGSEFDRVLLVLPPDPSRLLTRELLYTGITRARRAVAIWGDALVFGAGIERRLERASGLGDALWSR